MSMAYREWQKYGMLYLAGNGGRGSFSYAEPAVHGERQMRQDLEIMIPRQPYWLGSFDRELRPILPGGGGGGKANGQFRYGSNATGFSPNGIVVIRLTRVGE